MGIIFMALTMPWIAQLSIAFPMKDSTTVTPPPETPTSVRAKEESPYNSTNAGVDATNSTTEDCEWSTIFICGPINKINAYSQFKFTCDGEHTFYNLIYNYKSQSLTFESVQQVKQLFRDRWTYYLEIMRFLRKCISPKSFWNQRISNRLYRVLPGRFH